jgi:hypothetical protein
LSSRLELPGIGQNAGRGQHQADDAGIRFARIDEGVELPGSYLQMQMQVLMRRVQGLRVAESGNAGQCAAVPAGTGRDRQVLFRQEAV